FFEDSLRNFDLRVYGCEKIAILHIDVDLYRSCQIVLNAVTNFIQTGTIVLFDDWNCFNASSKKGERAATREWLDRNPHIRLNEYAYYGWHGISFIVEMDES